MERDTFRLARVLDPLDRSFQLQSQCQVILLFSMCVLHHGTYVSLFSEEDIDHPAKGRPQSAPQPSLRRRKPSQSRAEPHRWYQDMQNFSSQSQWVYLYHYQSPEKQSSKRGLMTCPFKVLEQVSALVTLPPLRTCLSRAHRAYRHQLSLVISHFVVKYPGFIMTEPKMCSLWGFLKFLEREGKYTFLVDQRCKHMIMSVPPDVRGVLCVSIF